jgi:hypothetical protein
MEVTMEENKKNRTTTVIGIVALVLVCTLLGALAGAATGGAAGRRR